MKRDEFEEYAEEFSTPEPEVLARLNRETHLSRVYPRMLSGHLQGTLLRMISHMIRPLRILEIGTFTGYSAICLASGLKDGGLLHTIEVNPEEETMIRKYVEEAGLSAKIILHMTEQWDLVFIDADKPNYLKYYNMVFDYVRPGGFIMADNAYWGGKVLDPKTNDKETLGIIEFNEFVRNDERVENLLLPIRDGLMLVRKIA